MPTESESPAVFAMIVQMTRGDVILGGKTRVAGWELDGVCGSGVCYADDIVLVSCDPHILDAACFHAFENRSRSVAAGFTGNSSARFWTSQRVRAPRCCAQGPKLEATATTEFFCLCLFRSTSRAV